MGVKLFLLLLWIFHPPLPPDLRHEMHDIHSRVQPHARGIASDRLLHVEHLVAERLRRTARENLLAPAVLRPGDDSLVAARLPFRRLHRLRELATDDADAERRPAVTKLIHRPSPFNARCNARGTAC